METQPLRSLPLLSILLLFSPFFATTYAAETGKPLITKTCNRTYYPEDCVKALESDPRSSNADMPTLARISMEVSSSKVKKGYPEVREWTLKASDYLTWAMYSACTANYNQSIADMNMGLRLFDGKEYKDALSKVVAVNSAVVTCNNFNLAPISQLNGALIALTNNTGTILSLLF
ncbi:hypothetical protein SLEP1_g39357 [Rubroshorea leprosula]|uniref:Pectinesterase inhibitor domain-containing protein n=1 Tax=Rubroshorea leprosula TaxID=152421 RepID=A0AAV5KZY2_9ROSI|nr:hypothetical protein SLEP1_g39357 [Rubroshorea leprosula]